MSETILINYKNKNEYFRQTEEYIFLDSIEVLPGKSARGYKNVTLQDWYFRYHFPGNPVMPGVFQMEALMQTGGLIINTMDGKKDLTLMFSECKNSRLYQTVRPGMVLNTEVELYSYKRGVAWLKGEARVGDQLSCSMQFSLIAPEEVALVMGRRNL